MSDQTEYVKQLKTFASLIYKDIRDYINEHREEYEEWTHNNEDSE